MSFDKYILCKYIAICGDLCCNVYCQFKKGVVPVCNSDHQKTPLFDALRRYADEGTISFHVPGHKHGNGLPEFTQFVGKNVMNIDLTILPDLDSIYHPTGAIKEAQDLAADAYGAEHAFFLVNGTTSGIQAMVMSVCREEDEIIVPRNAHKSVIGGIILSGAKPVYVQPQIDDFYGIAKGVEPETVARALADHPAAKAVFVIHPTYYGMASNLPKIVEIAHGYGVPVIVDEAHGAHFPFHPALPVAAMAAGADMSAASVHKLAGSMTQSSILLLRSDYIDPKHVKTILNLTQTTSPSYVLMASLDVARKQMILQGEQRISRTLELSSLARQVMNKINGIRVAGEEMIGTPGCWAYDATKLMINVRGLGLTGYEAETILRKKHQLAFELSDYHNLLAVVSLGDNENTVGRLIAGIADLAEQCGSKQYAEKAIRLPATPEMVTLPREAFYSDAKAIDLNCAAGEVSAEMVMAYPPGIPIVCPGERITPEIIDHIQDLKAGRARLQGPEDPALQQIKVLSRNLFVVQSSIAVG